MKTIFEKFEKENDTKMKDKAKENDDKL